MDYLGLLYSENGTLQTRKVSICDHSFYYKNTTPRLTIFSLAPLIDLLIQFLLNIHLNSLSFLIWDIFN